MKRRDEYEKGVLGTDYNRPFNSGVSIHGPGLHCVHAEKGYAYDG
jgi:hypothetical protein